MEELDLRKEFRQLEALYATSYTLHREFLPANGLVESGHHHEIYISDPRRTAPNKLKTVLRQPVRRA